MRRFPSFAEFVLLCKKNAVKTSSMTIALQAFAAVLLFSCSTKDLALMPHDFRGSGMARLDTVRKIRADSSLMTTQKSVYVSAVVAPEDYDWQQDSVFGASGFKVILMKDYEEILSLDTGKESLVSPEPDLHHIIGGHLYTEYTTDSETIIKKDGTELFRYRGREWLKGILPSSDSLYTLGQSRNGSGFSFRLNGNAVMVKNYGTVCGGFGQCNFNGNGALYYSYDDICFDYLADSVKFHVCSGTDNARNNGYNVKHLSMQYEDSFLYYEFPKGFGAEISYLDNGIFSLPPDIPEGSYYFFPTGGGAFLEDTLYLALTPKDRNRKPFVWCNGDCREIDVNGFLTGIEIIAR